MGSTLPGMDDGGVLGAGSREPGAGSRDCVRGPDSSRRKHRLPERAADAMGRADVARRERPSRRLSFGPRRPAGPALSPSSPGFLSRFSGIRRPAGPASSRSASAASRARVPGRSPGLYWVRRAAAALLLGLAALAASPQPASAAPCPGDTVPEGSFWSGCMTVGVRVTTGILGTTVTGYRSLGDLGRLSSTTFSAGSRRLSIHSLFHDSAHGSVRIRFPSRPEDAVIPSFTSGWVMQIGSEAYDFADAHYTEPGTRGNQATVYDWGESVSWTEGQRLTVSLRDESILPPEPESATVDGDRLNIVWSEPLSSRVGCGSVEHCASSTMAGAFEVSVGGSARTISAFEISDDEIQIGLASPVGRGDAVTVSYEPPDELYAIKDRDASFARGFTDLAAENRTTTINGLPVATVEDVTASERDGRMVFRLRLSAPAPAGGVKAFVETRGRTATSGIDYVPTVEKFPIAAGETEYEITVDIIADDEDEDDEYFRLALGLESGAVHPDGRGDSPLQGREVATGTIVDDDELPGPPRALSATPGSGEVTLRWTAGDARTARLTGHEYRQSADGGTNWGSWTAIPGRLGLDSTPGSYTVTGLTNGTTYSFELRAVSAVGKGASSADAATLKATPLQPGLWTAALTMGVKATVNFGWLSDGSFTGAALSDDDFTIGSTSYTVKGIAIDALHRLAITTEPALNATATSGMTLDVGGHEADFSDATFGLGLGQTTQWAAESSKPSQFTTGNTVNVRIVSGTADQNPANSAATGRPVIVDDIADPADANDPNQTVTHYEQGEELTAKLDEAPHALADANGLPSGDSDYTWQWLRDGEPISGETSKTYTPVADDIGKRLSVRVSFTDDDGYAEVVTSDRGTPVEPRFFLNVTWANEGREARVREGESLPLAVTAWTSNNRHPRTAISRSPTSAITFNSARDTARADRDYRSTSQDFEIDVHRLEWRQASRDGRTVWELSAPHRDSRDLVTLADTRLEGEERFSVVLDRRRGNFNLPDRRLNITIEDATAVPATVEVRLSDTAVSRDGEATLTFMPPAGRSWGGWPVTFLLHPGLAEDWPELDSVCVDDMDPCDWNMKVSGGGAVRVDTSIPMWTAELGSRTSASSQPVTVSVVNKSDSTMENGTLLVLLPDAGTAALTRPGGRPLLYWVLRLQAPGVQNQVLIDAPGVPLSRAEPGDGAVTLFWTAPEYDGEITGWELRYGEFDTETDAPEWGEWTAIEGATAETASHTVTGLANGTPYAFQLRAMAGATAGEATLPMVTFPLAALAADADSAREGATPLDAGAAARSVQYHRGKSLDRAAGDAVDYYTFTLTERKELGFGVRGQSIDLDFFLEDAQGGRLMASWPPPVDASVEWMKTVLDPGTYYIRVEAQADGQTGYYLRFGLAPAAPADADSVRAGAVSLGAQSPARGRQFFRDKSLDRAAGDAVDYYRFTTDGRYELGLGVRGQSVELKVVLEDSNGTAVGTAGPPLNPNLDQVHIEWLKQVIEPGTYYVRVEALADGATGYYLRFGLTAPPPAVSVTDARAAEGADARLDFTVSLDRAATKTATVSLVSKAVPRRA